MTFAAVARALGRIKLRTAARHSPPSIPLTNMPMIAPREQRRASVSCEIDQTMMKAPAWKVTAPDAADPVGKLPDTKMPTPSQHRDGSPQRRLRQRVAEARRQITRQPDHQSVVTEVLHRAEDQHAQADISRRGILHEKAERHGRPALPGAIQEYLRLLHIPANRKGE